jgi:putative ABC transport system permease protein
VAAASSALFLSSAGNEALNREIDKLNAHDSGLYINGYGPPNSAQYESADLMLTERVNEMENLEAPSARVLSDSLSVASPELPRDAEPEIRLIYRVGAENNIEALDEAGGEGAWLPAGVARAAGVTAGERVEFRYGSRTESQRVAGIYRDLPSRPLNDYWAPMTYEILSLGPNQPQPPPLVILPREQLFETAEPMGLPLRYQWEMPLSASRMTLEEGQTLLAQQQSLELEIRNDETTIGESFDAIALAYGGAEFSSAFPNAVQRVEDTIVSITGPVELLSLGGRAVALIVFAAAGIFAVQRRRIEVRLLSSQGVSPFSQGLRASIECFLPAVLGVTAGWGVALYLVRAIGPTSALSPGVESDAFRTVLWASALAIVLYGAVTTISARGEVETGHARLRGIVARIPWEPLVLVLAGASFYEIVTRGEAVVTSAEGVPEVDILLLLFPILFIIGMAGVAGRGLRRLLPSIRKLGDRSSPPMYLATRRLAGASRIALVLITASSISLGLLVYASILVSSNEATAHAKANLSVGSDVAVPVQTSRPNELLRTEFDFPYAFVTRTEDGEVQPGEMVFDTLGIDPKTFGNAAYFDESFASEDMDELVNRLQPFEGDSLTAILVASDDEIPDGSIYVTPRYDVPIEIVGTASAWPGLSADRPMLVTRYDALFAVSEASDSSVSEELISDYELWARADAAEVEAALLANQINYNPVSVRSTAELLASPSFLALSWTFGYLQALGIMAGAIALAGMLLYLQTRQQAREVSYALARRMGLRRSAHRWAVALELGGMLLVSLVIAVGLALIASLLVYGRLDPLPTLPPDPLFAFPLLLIAVLLPLIAVAALLGAWRVQRGADTAKVSEVLRYAN